MRANAQLRQKLWTLINEGQLAWSQCGPSFLHFIAPLLEAGVVRHEKSGAGRKLVVRDGDAARVFFNIKFPGSDASAQSSTRITAVARFRSSKAIRNNAPVIVHLRAGSAGSIVFPGNAIEVDAATRLHGLFAFQLEDTDPFIELHGTWVLVENPALFFRHLDVFGNAASAILLNGLAPNRLVRWLKNQSADDLKLVHAPDYDPTGIAEFVRLKKQLGPALELFVPDTIAELFNRFADPALLLKPRQQTALRQLRDSEDPLIQRLVGLMMRHNAGLEQEVLLIG